MIKKQDQILKRDISEIIFNVIKYVFLFIFMIMCIYPFYYVIIYSISDPNLARQGVHLLPKGFSLNTYIELLKGGEIVTAYIVSIARTVIGTFFTVLFTSFLAFLMTRKEMPCRKLIYRYFVITMYLSAGMIPWYLTMKAYHLKDNFLLYVIPTAINAYYMILFKTFMEQLPESLEESAAIEGAGRFDIFFKIVFPLSKPIIATIAVYSAVGQWNSWQDNFFLIHDSKLQTLQLVLYNFINSADTVAKAMQSGGAGSVMAAQNAARTITPESVQMVAIVVTVIPIMLVYPFLQKHFTSGIMMGAIKG